jgi:glutathione S-transferase
MANLTLYHVAPSRSSVVLWMLEELGEPYDLEVMSFTKDDLRTPDYLKINPMGKVPALKHGDTIVTEGAAICTYLADAFPQAKLNVPIGDPRRGPYLKWLFFGPSCVEAAIADRAFPRAGEAPRRALGYGDHESVMNVLSEGVRGGPYLLGEQFTAADVVIGSGIRWGMMFKGIPERPEFIAYAKRLAERPAAKRATAKDQQLKAAAEAAA